MHVELGAIDDNIFTRAIAGPGLTLAALRDGGLGAHKASNSDPIVILSLRGVVIPHESSQIDGGHLRGEVGDLSGILKITHIRAAFAVERIEMKRCGSACRKGNTRGDASDCILGKMIGGIRPESYVAAAIPDLIAGTPIIEIRDGVGGETNARFPARVGAQGIGGRGPYAAVGIESEDAAGNRGRAQGHCPLAGVHGRARKTVMEEEDVERVGRRSSRGSIAVVQVVVTVGRARRNGRLCPEPNLSRSTVPGGIVIQGAVELHPACTRIEQHADVVAAGQRLPCGHQAGVVEGDRNGVAVGNRGSTGGDRNPLPESVAGVPPLAGRAALRLVFDQQAKIGDRAVQPPLRDVGHAPITQHGPVDGRSRRGAAGLSIRRSAINVPSRSGPVGGAVASVPGDASLGPSGSASDAADLLIARGDWRRADQDLQVGDLHGGRGGDAGEVELNHRTGGGACCAEDAEAGGGAVVRGGESTLERRVGDGREREYLVRVHQTTRGYRAHSQQHDQAQRDERAGI